MCASDLNFCVEVATRVLEYPRVLLPWKDEYNKGSCFIFHENVYLKVSGEEQPFLPDVDANDDFLVPFRVRRKWINSKRDRFACELAMLFGRMPPEEAWPTRALCYSIGDYSRAALAAVK
jgi:hypothetical protein